MAKSIHWLLGEIETWRREGIITANQAEQITARYPAVQPTPAWGRIIFFSLGAILIGLGVILLFAYNWQALHKGVKLGVVFGGLIMAHGLGVWFSRSGRQQQALGESMHLLATLLFGSGIWLIAQIYHIDAHYPNGILFWSLGALAMAWALPSIAQGLVATFLLSYWSGCEVLDFGEPNHWAPLTILLMILPLAWLQRSRVLLSMGLASLLIIVAFNCARLDSDLFVPLFLLLANGLIAASLLVSQSDSFPAARRQLSFFGHFLYFIILYALTFHAVNRPFYEALSTPPALLYLAISGIALLVCWGGLLVQSWHNAIPFWKTLPLVQLAQLGAQLLTLVLVFAFGLLEQWGSALLFNLLLLFHAVLLIVQGCRTVHWQQATLGCLLFSILAISRYTDLFTSLIARSLVFFIVGGAIFGIGFFYTQSKKQGEVKR